jgi:hypothetical protein
MNAPQRYQLETGPLADLPIPAIFKRTGAEPSVTHAPLVPTGIEAAVCADIARRQALGFQKYGVTVAANPLPVRAWMQHAYEEALDFAIYLKRAISQVDADTAARTNQSDAMP